MRIDVREHEIKKDCIKTPFFMREKLAVHFTDFSSKVTKNTVKLKELQRKKPFIKIFTVQHNIF